MADFNLVNVVVIASALFVAELTDKDAFLLLSMSTRVRARLAFFAGVTAFAMTTALFVTLGTVLISVVPVIWVKAAGGAVMIGYGVWELRGVLEARGVEEGESRIERERSPWRMFGVMVGTLALLDIAGDATEVLTMVFVAQYANPALVFVAALVGLISATGVETLVGNRLGHLLTPRRIRYGSAAVFLLLGAAVIISSL
jgi:Ca2+/H+ antiporter, TMEM165/GDT1 family